MNLKSSIAPDALQAVLDASSNAAQKGQAQWHTPYEWGKALAIPLPDLRPNITDLTCGNGQLLQAVRLRDSTTFGCEIQPSTIHHPPSTFPTHRTTADITTLYPLLRAAKWQGDLFVLNPPWDVHFYREKLAALANSEEPAVQAAFAAHDGRTSRDTIDSTVATLCMALDRGTYYSEGFIVANESTLQRLILGTGAPHSALAQHCWAHLIVDGNICDPKQSTINYQPSTTFRTGILYFANGHTKGIQVVGEMDDITTARKTLLQWKRDRVLHRSGAGTESWTVDKNDPDWPWKAAREELERLQDNTKKLYNLWLEPDGTIKTALSLFDEASGRVDTALAGKLHDLNGKRPSQLIMQMQQRRALLHLVRPVSSILHPPSSAPWRVCPELVAAVDKAVRDYEAHRAPLTRLNPIQRLGYLDEHEFIHCQQDLGDGGWGIASGVLADPTPDPRPQTPDSRTIPLFHAGGRYALRCCTVMVKRSGRKMNLHGEYDDVQWDGQELAIYVTDDFGTERLFMEGRLRGDNVKVCAVAPHQIAAFKRMGVGDVAAPCAIDFTLQELIAHFDIPDVADVATLQPDRYQHNLNQLRLMQRG